MELKTCKQVLSAIKQISALYLVNEKSHYYITYNKADAPTQQQVLEFEVGDLTVRVLRIEEYMYSWPFYYLVSSCLYKIKITSTLELHACGLVVIKTLMPQLIAYTAQEALCIKFIDFDIDWELLYLLLKSCKIVVIRVNSNKKNIRTAPVLPINALNLKKLVLNEDYLERKNSSDETTYNYISYIAAYHI